MKHTAKRHRAVHPSGAGFETIRLAGETDGPHLLVTAGVHGSEYPGILACRRVLQRLEGKRIRGRLTLVPLCNEGAFYGFSRFVSPEDGVNLNRAFPAAKGDTHTYGLASLLEDLFSDGVDFFLDLHSGDTSEWAMDFAYIPYLGEREAVRSRAEAAVTALGLSAWTHSHSQAGAINRAAGMGIPSILAERGGQGRWSEAQVEGYVRDILSLMSHLDMLDEPTLSSAPIHIPKVSYIEAPSRGFWFLEGEPGRILRAGDRLGLLETLEGEVLLEVRAPSDGMVLYGTTGAGVSQGDPLVAFGCLPSEGR